jgi:hypothetical protein
MYALYTRPRNDPDQRFSLTATNSSESVLWHLISDAEDGIVRPWPHGAADPPRTYIAKEGAD